MAMVRKSLGDILVEKGLLKPEQLQQALSTQKSTPSLDLGQVIIDLEFATDVDVYTAKAAEAGVPFIDLTKHKPEPTAINVVPQNIVQKHNAMPVRKVDQKLWVAMKDPRNIMAVDDIRMVSRCQVIPMAAVPRDLEDAITKAYGAGGVSAAPSSGGPSTAVVPAVGGGMADIKKAMVEMELPGGKEVDEGASDEQAAEQAPVVRMANAILVAAIDGGASDIHIEPSVRNVRIRNRVDGVLREVMMVPNHIKGPLISRYKIMSDMNIAERRVPQDGRIPIKHNNKDYDMRVSCLPSMFGEKIVMRILDKGSVMLGLNKLGFSPTVQADLEDLTVQPNGMFLVTGPTGSGKTTTLYSVLNKVNSIEKNIITVEDPVEYQLGGLTQVQINKKAGLNFANALRCFLRQDPDIIMVGEMRDLETAEIAIEAALTGHLVLSTLHTNDAPSTTMRLADMGVEPFLISATVIGILAQRLTRRVCSNCKEPYQVKASELLRFGYKPDDMNEEVTLWRGKGCEICGNTGLKGRMGVYELLRMNSEIAELVVRRAPLQDIKDAAHRAGMKDMRDDGFQKILQGMTTPDEVMRVVFTAGQV